MRLAMEEQRQLQKIRNKTTYSHGNTALSDTTRAADLLSKFREDHKDTLTDDVISKLTSDIEKVNVYESAEDTLDDSDEYSRKKIIPFRRNIIKAAQVQLQI